MTTNPIRSDAPATAAAASPKGGKYQDLGYVGVGFEHTIQGQTGPFTIINVSFDQGSDLVKLGQMLADGKHFLSLRPRKEEGRRVANMGYSVVLREQVA